MSGYLPFGVGGAPANIDTTYEGIGFGATGGPTALAGGAANTKAASFTTLSASLANDIAGFWLFMSISSGSSSRSLLDIATGAADAEVVKVPDVFGLMNVVGSGAAVMFMPLNLSAGERVSARVQGNGVGGAASVALLGEVRTANHPPLWDNCELLAAADNANTRAGSISVPAVGVVNTGWATLGTTARPYGAVLANLAGGASNPATAQSMSLRLGLGGSGAGDATWFASTPWNVNTANPAVPRFPGIPIYKAIPAGIRVAAEILCDTPGSDGYFPQLFGFY